VQLPEGTTLLTDAEILVVNVVASPTEAQLEAELDTEGAGVVEDQPESADDEPAAESEDSDS
jgi:large subunit ribosomal protein L25